MARLLKLSHVMKLKLLSIAAVIAVSHTVMAQSVSVIERDGVRLHVFLSKPVIFQVASVVLEGESEVALVDAQFSADNAAAVAELIRATGKPLTTIFISHSDPDYYFGLGVIADAFPDAKILATPQTKWLIETTKDDKMAVWAPQLEALGGLAPKRIVVPAAIQGDHFTVDGRRVEVKQLPGDEGHAFLWIPLARTILGGVYLNEGEHLWVADSPLREDRAKWLAALTAMETLVPQLAIPAHFTPPSVVKPGLASSGTTAIGFTQGYLSALERTLEETKTFAEVISRMKALYPALAGESALEMTAKVLTGETAWKVARAFPAIGRKAEVDFGGEYDFILDFHNEHSMTFTGQKPRANNRPITDTVEYTAVEIARGIYMVYWTEKDKTHVVHIENYADGVVYTNITPPDGSFTNLRGTLRLLDK
jgi:glyoxylase-like metal-dependent hydrolase (beta-lactamase superfamily II)